MSERPRYTAGRIAGAGMAAFAQVAPVAMVEQYRGISSGDYGNNNGPSLPGWQTGTEQVVGNSGDKGRNSQTRAVMVTQNNSAQVTNSVKIERHQRIRLIDDGNTGGRIHGADHSPVQGAEIPGVNDEKLQQRADFRAGRQSDKVVLENVGGLVDGLAEVWSDHLPPNSVLSEMVDAATFGYVDQGNLGDWFGGVAEEMVGSVDRMIGKSSINDQQLGQLAKLENISVMPEEFGLNDLRQQLTKNEFRQAQLLVKDLTTKIDQSAVDIAKEVYSACDRLPDSAKTAAAVFILTTLALGAYEYRKTGSVRNTGFTALLLGGMLLTACGGVPVEQTAPQETSTVESVEPTATATPRPEASVTPTYANEESSFSENEIYQQERDRLAIAGLIWGQGSIAKEFISHDGSRVMTEIETGSAMFGATPYEAGTRLVRSALNPREVYFVTPTEFAASMNRMGATWITPESIGDVIWADDGGVYVLDANGALLGRVTSENEEYLPAFLESLYVEAAYVVGENQLYDADGKLLAQMINGSWVSEDGVQVVEATAIPTVVPTEVPIEPTVEPTATVVSEQTLTQGLEAFAASQVTGQLEMVYSVHPEIQVNEEQAKNFYNYFIEVVTTSKGFEPYWQALGLYDRDSIVNYLEQNDYVIPTRVNDVYFPNERMTNGIVVTGQETDWEREGSGSLTTIDLGKLGFMLINDGVVGNNQTQIGEMFGPNKIFYVGYGMGFSVRYLAHNGIGTPILIIKEADKMDVYPASEDASLKGDPTSNSGYLEQLTYQVTTVARYMSTDYPTQPESNNCGRPGQTEIGQRGFCIPDSSEGIQTTNFLGANIHTATRLGIVDLFGIDLD